MTTTKMGRRNGAVRNRRIVGILIPVTGNAKAVDIEQDKERDCYDFLKANIAGCCSNVPLLIDGKCVANMYIDESGLLKKLPPNTAATKLNSEAVQRFNCGIPFVGPALVLGKTNASGTSKPMAEKLVARILALAGADYGQDAGQGAAQK